MVKRPSLFRKFELCAHTEQDAQGLVFQSNSVFPASKPALRSPCPSSAAQSSPGPWGVAYFFPKNTTPFLV